MAVVRWFLLVLSLAFVVAASDLAAQNRSSFSQSRRVRRLHGGAQYARPGQAGDGDGGLHRLVSRQRAAHRCLRAGDGGLARRQPAGQGRRHRRQAAAGRSRQCARARQSHLRRARARHPGRQGGDGVDGRDGGARPGWRCAKWRKPAGAHRRRLRAHQAAVGRACSTARWAIAALAGQGLRQGTAPLSRGGGGRARQSARTSISSPWRNSRARRSMRWASGMPRAPSPSRAPPRATPPPPTSTVTCARATASIAAARRAGTSCWRGSSRASARRRRASSKSIPHALTPPEAALQVVDEQRSRRRCPSPTGRSCCAIATPRRPTRRRRTRCGR